MVSLYPPVMPVQTAAFLPARLPNVGVQQPSPVSINVYATQPGPAAPALSNPAQTGFYGGEALLPSLLTGGIPTVPLGINPQDVLIKAYNQAKAATENYFNLAYMMQQAKNSFGPQTPIPAAGFPTLPPGIMPPPSFGPPMGPPPSFGPPMGPPPFPPMGPPPSFGPPMGPPPFPPMGPPPSFGPPMGPPPFPPMGPPPSFGPPMGPPPLPPMGPPPSFGPPMGPPPLPPMGPPPSFGPPMGPPPFPPMGPPPSFGPPMGPQRPF